jgi:hypothetical protein
MIISVKKRLIILKKRTTIISFLVSISLRRNRLRQRLRRLLRILILRILEILILRVSLI